MTAVLVGIFFAIFGGAALQRISGMGLGLIAAPALSVLLGPVAGVLMVNVLATMNAVANTYSMRERVDWKRFAPIAAALVLGAVPGAFLIRAISTDLLLIIVGVLLLIALSTVTLGKRYIPNIEGTVPSVIAGTVGGFMNTLAGVAGPSITVYAHAARWPKEIYAATLQPIFLVGGAVSFAIKEATGAANLAAVTPETWVVGIIAMVLGIIVGTRVAPRVPVNLAYRIALSLAIFGGFTALVRGLVGMLSA
ncbi:sulfite exporter TauE/SafE family protein [Corynebacterium riegelii]|uniref:sulfite exporter TauE/SafE family protein n=1 Tax=Corynebacterium riegelii TaxID=156976 RepID=UPI0023F581DC|nr:sulfite exporter TauE/SafE family protein [Corynebacterium riegelii]